MNNLADRMPIPDVQLLVSAVLIQKESGGNLAEILEKRRLSIIRERFRLKRQIPRSYRAGPSHGLDSRGHAGDTWFPALPVGS